MNGAEVILKTAASAGVDVCFANAGTTEMPIAVAFDEMPTIRPILGLFEGVCTGAADGYGRMKNKPAMTLLHLGPGLGNGIANLHNARRAHSPVFNVVGDHASWHLAADAPLTMDIAALSSTVSGWQRINRSTENLSQDTADAITAARPGYKPWFQPLWKPPSDEVESLLFSLQAAIGAGFLGYVIGRRSADKNVAGR